MTGMLLALLLTAAPARAKCVGGGGFGGVRFDPVCFEDIDLRADPDSLRMQMMPREIAIPPAHGTRDPASISSKYARPATGENPAGGGVAPGEAPADEAKASVETARANMAEVIRLSLSRFADAAKLEGSRSLSKRLSQLTLVGFKASSVREDPLHSGQYVAEAVFRDKTTGADVEADVYADFSDPHWHLNEIRLRLPPKDAPPAKEPAAEAAASPDCRSAVAAYIKERSAPGRGFTVASPELGRTWPAFVRSFRGVKAEEDRCGAAVEFVDLSQQHVLVADFTARLIGGQWRVGAPSLRSVDGRELAAPAGTPPADVRLAPVSR